MMSLTLSLATSASAAHFCKDKILKFKADYDAAILRVREIVYPVLKSTDPNYPYECPVIGDCFAQSVSPNLNDPAPFSDIESMADPQVAVDYWNKVNRKGQYEKETAETLAKLVQSVAIDPLSDAWAQKELAEKILNRALKDMTVSCEQMQATSAGIKDLYYQEGLWWDAIKDAFWIDFSSNYLKVTGNAILFVTGLRETYLLGKSLMLGYKSKKIFFDSLGKVWHRAITATESPIAVNMVENIKYIVPILKKFCEVKYRGDVAGYAKCMIMAPYHFMVEHNPLFTEDQKVKYIIHGLRNQERVVTEATTWATQVQNASVWSVSVKSIALGRSVTEFVLDGTPIYEFPDVQSPFTPMLENSLSLYKKFSQAFKAELSDANESLGIYEAAARYYNAIRASRATTPPTCINQYLQKTINGICTWESSFNPI